MTDSRMTGLEPVLRSVSLQQTQRQLMDNDAGGEGLTEGRQFSSVGKAKEIWVWLL